ncbi:SAM-dependent chlorinase/fluorinase [Aurantibacter crassamenti]|uniref:SAM hydrolase/SAM-dependent halogenase family protein n=1 Tax=Aurantibacter crassamenti TaxID=1837375 RepID=UPI001939FCB8|nr:SAM-dependent chlorinase/fluorinase [Aurantibacter crassamenti]MBM1106817.1 SAM-dependent chlorinase/fluorinase [Aurantibacter crassamenti]
MAIITLTTDFGLKDHFVGAVKGAIYKELADANIVDISHNVGPFNIQECAYILQNSYKHFPEGTVHVIGVDSEITEETRHIAALLNGHYFICADNGILDLLKSDAPPTKIVEIAIHNADSGSFPLNEVFVRVACHIARGGTLEVVGKPIKELHEVRDLSPSVTDSGNKIIGSVLYIDNYGNVVTNIHKNFFEAYRKGRDFEIQARAKVLTKIYKKYSDIVDFSLEKNRRKGAGELLAIYNSSGYIEIAIYKSNPKAGGSASSLLGLEYLDAISINFK